MKYGVFFILVFLAGFGILQYLNSKETTPLLPASTEEVEPSETKSPPLAIDTTTIIEDTTSYSYTLIESKVMSFLLKRQETKLLSYFQPFPLPVVSFVVVLEQKQLWMYS